MRKTILSLLLLLCTAVGMAQNNGVRVKTIQEFKNALDQGKTYINIDADIYLSDLKEQTFLETFSGTIEGNCHTI